MRINLKSLRIQLCLLHTTFALTLMTCLGSFSYWYLGRQLASARQQTLQAREARVIRYVNSWPKKDSSLTLAEKLRQLSTGLASTDLIQVYDLNGNVLFSTPGNDNLKVPWPNRLCVERCFDLVERDGHSVRTLDHVVEFEGRPVRLSLSGTIDEHAEILRAVRNSYLIFCPLLLFASIAGGYLISRRALEPISRMTAEARILGIRDLQRRLPVPATGDELQHLAEAWNELLDRLEAAVARLTQFTGDISHDLNTAITIMLTTIGLALNKDRTKREYQTTLQSVAVECEATTRLLDDLLAVARADFVQQRVDRRHVDFGALVEETCGQFDARARLKQQKLDFSVGGCASVAGDASLLRRMVAILLDNAIKYTPDAGRISVSILESAGVVRLAVRDTGIGIPPEALPRIFDRFYRVDTSRPDEGGSSGLGLSIAKWVAEAHQATISVDSRPGNGSTFTIALPSIARGT